MNEDNDEFNAMAPSWGPPLVGRVEPVTRHDIDNLDNKVNKLIISLTQKDKDTQRLFEGVVKIDNKTNDFKDAVRVLLYDLIMRADNLEMKLRTTGYLSKKHAIEYQPYTKLHDKPGSRHTPPLNNFKTFPDLPGSHRHDPKDNRYTYPARLELRPHHRTNTTIANKYIVL